MDKQYAYLFPGQGAQSPGMGRDIVEASREAKECLDKISSAASEDIGALLWDTDKVTLSRSDRSQLAILSVELIAYEALKARGILPSVCMGFSLGEFAALYSAGVLSFDSVVKIVKERGKIMQEVCDKIASNSGGAAPGMAAVLGLAPETVLETIAGIEGVYAANMNSVRQTVISGTAGALKAAESALKAAGAKRVVHLAVAGPYHCPLMADAASAFDKYLNDSGILWNDPNSDIVLYSNVTGERVLSGSDARANAVRHLTSPVLWTREEALLATAISEGDWGILEVGPGKVLTGLWRDTGASSVCTPCGTSDAIVAL